MGQNFSFIPFKRSPKQAPKDNNTSQQPDIFSKLTPRVKKPNDFIYLISNCISAASARTQEYLVFRDPEEKFHPSPQVLIQVFLMTFITQSLCHNLTDTFSCTLMTPEQRILLGADWVWAMLDKPTKNPKIQIFVQVLHLPEREKHEESTAESNSESIKMAQMESSSKTKCKRMIDFCASIGKDCYALFLFFGRRDDGENIYGVLSNSFEVAIATCNETDRVLIENFFKGSQCFHSPLGIMEALFSNKMGKPLTLTAKFSSNKP